MKSFHRVSGSLLFSFFLLPLLLAGCNTQVTDQGGAALTDNYDVALALSSLPVDALSTTESEGLVYMREEEKLARDVYIFLHEKWGSKVFANIADSEQTHTDVMLLLLEKYAIEDPVGNNAQGVFADEYLQALYDSLVARGSASLIDALFVGAIIEETDILDIQKMIDALEGNADIVLVYENLMAGSRNHLRAFVRNLEKQGVTYQPTYITQDEYDAIISVVR